MSAAEAAQPPAEGVDDAETEAEPAIPLAALNEVTIKRGTTSLLKALIQQSSSESELTQGKSTPGTLSIRSSEKVGTAADGSLVGLVHEILLSERWHLSTRKTWDCVRAWIPKTEGEYWKLGATSQLINVTIEKRQFAVKGILTELVKKEPSMAAALTDFGTTDEEKLACTRRVCALLEAFHTSTLVLPKQKPKPKAKAKPAAGGSSSSDPPPPTTPAKVPLKSKVEELAAYVPSQVHSAAELLSKNSSPILRAENVTPTSRKRFRELSQLVAGRVVEEIPKERPERSFGPNALALLQYIQNTGAKTLKADAGRVVLQQRALFPEPEGGDLEGGGGLGDGGEVEDEGAAEAAAAGG